MHHLFGPAFAASSFGWLWLSMCLIGGAFGQFINVEKAIQIGLLPDLPARRPERIRKLGR